MNGQPAIRVTGLRKSFGDQVALDGIDRGILVLRHETNRGIGATMKEVFQYALDRD